MLKIYGTPNCVWCDRAKLLAEKHELDYQYIDVSQSQELQVWFKEQGWRTVPQIKDDNSYIGGYESLATHIKEGWQ